MPKYLKQILYVGIGILFLFNIYRLTQKKWSYADPIDFRGLYLGAEMLNTNAEIYNDSIATEYWNQHKTLEDFESKTDFGDKWVSIMVYPPHAFTVAYPFSKLSWKASRILWWVLAFICLMLFCLLLFKVTKDWMMVALALAFKGSVFALMLGQPMLLVIVCLMGSIYFQKSRPVLAGLLLGIAMIKFNLAIPVALWFLLQKDLKLLITGAITSILLLLPAVLNHADIIPAYLDKVGAYYDMIYNPQAHNIYTYSNSELTIFLDYYWNQSTSVWKFVNLIGQALGYLLFAVLYIKKRCSKEILLLGLLLVSFCFSYHLVYDALIFIIPLAMLKDLRHRIIGIMSFIILSLPINSALGDITILKFHYPIIITVGLILLIFASLRHVSEHPTS